MASHRGDLTERLIRIPLLLTERPHSQQELAADFNVDGITIRRNINDLSRFYPIIDERIGRETIYKFSDGYQYKPPSLSPTELAVLLLAQQSVAATGLTHFGTPFAGHGQLLLEKVRAALPQRLREYLDTLANIFGAAFVPAKDYSPHAETLDQLTMAAASNRTVRLRYHTLHDDLIKDRDFDPYAVYFDPDGATLKTIGRDHASDMIKPFSIDRIKSLSESGRSFVRPPDFNLQEFLIRYCFNGIHGEPVLVRLRVYGIAARVFAERRFHPSQEVIEPLARDERGEETIAIEMSVAGGRGLLRFILSWGADIQVLSPFELRAEVAEVHRQSLCRLAEIQ